MDIKTKKSTKEQKEEVFSSSYFVAHVVRCQKIVLEKRMVGSGRCEKGDVGLILLVCWIRTAICHVRTYLHD